MKFALPATIHIETTIAIETAFGDGKVTVVGPLDHDKDGDPEITVKWDVPGDSLDGAATVEVPLGMLAGPVLDLAAFALKASGVPGLGIIVDALEGLLKSAAR